MSQHKSSDIMMRRHFIPLDDLDVYKRKHLQLHGSFITTTLFFFTEDIINRSLFNGDDNKHTIIKYFCGLSSWRPKASDS
jgi:hypothetical protein